MPNRASTISPLRGLFEAANLVRTENDLPQALDRIATVVAEALGFQTVIINVYRREWDDFAAASVFGSDQLRAHLLGSTYERSWWEPILDERFDRHGARFIPEGSFDWASHTGGERFVPAIDPTSDQSLWHQEDELFVPFYDSNGELLGIFCVGEPTSGLRPTDEELGVLVAVAGHAGLAVEAAQVAAARSRNVLALEHLLRVSARLTETTSAESILDSIPAAISDALGFQKVCVMIADPSTRALTPRAAAGWSVDDEIFKSGPTPEEIAPLLDQEFEIAGCFLLPFSAGTARLQARHHTYSSTMNGRGPYAWSNHFLTVPLHDREGNLLGIIWADDPSDRQLPSRETLQMLRMFANQSTTALERAADFEELRELSVTRARLLEVEREHVAQLRGLDRMKDDFVALVSHELRTPLTSIRGYTELLLDAEDDEQHRQFLEVINRNADRLLSLVSDLLLIAEIQSGKLNLELTEVHLGQLVDEAGASARPTAAASEIELTVTAGADACVLGDRSRLGQVLDNLISNAIKFTPRGGRVGLTLSSNGGIARIDVSDTGIGIPASEQHRVFGRFFRSSAAREAAIKGTGLGLAITHGIIESHGGAISFASTPHEGTTFTVKLPLLATHRTHAAREHVLAGCD
jgi:signal transduction histidine kinase